MYNIKKNVLLGILATSTFVSGCNTQEKKEYQLINFTGIYPRTPAHAPFGSFYIIDSAKNRLDTLNLNIAGKVEKNFRLRRMGKDSLWMAPNRYAIAEISGEKPVDPDEIDERTVSWAKAVDSSASSLKYWQNKVTAANTSEEPEKILNIGK